MHESYKRILVGFEFQFFQISVLLTSKVHELLSTDVRQYRKLVDFNLANERNDFDGSVKVSHFWCELHSHWRIEKGWNQYGGDLLSFASQNYKDTWCRHRLQLATSLLRHPPSTPPLLSNLAFSHVRNQTLTMASNDKLFCFPIIIKFTIQSFIKR